MFCQCNLYYPLLQQSNRTAKKFYAGSNSYRESFLEAMNDIEDLS